MGKSRKNTSSVGSLGQSVPVSKENSSHPQNSPKRTEMYDDLHSSPLLHSLSQISHREKERIDNYVRSILKNPGVIGVLKVPVSHGSKMLPVSFVEGYREPVLVKALEISKDKHDLRLEYLKIQNTVSPLEVFEFSDRESIATVLKRTYIPLTLEDVLSSQMPVAPERVLDTLSKLFHQVSVLGKHSIVHGHIHPGNICYGGSSDGSLIDFGVSILERPYREIDKSYPPEFLGAPVNHSFDSYGLGFTLQKVFSEMRIVSSKEHPSIDAILSSFTPLISALMNRKPDKRPDAELARLMFLDIIPMVFPEYSFPVISDSLEERLRKGDAPLVDEEDELFSNDESNMHNDTVEDEHEKIHNVSSAFLYEEQPPDLQKNLEESLLSYSEFRSEEKSTGANPFDELEDHSPEPVKANHSSRFFANILFLVLLIIPGYLLYEGREKIFFTYESLQEHFIKDELSDYEVADQFQGPFLGLHELRAAWESQVPSRMKVVARQAVHSSQLRSLAEQVILTSLRRNEISSDLVDTKLLRVAFHDAWEDQLSEHDRRYALSLGLIGVLRDTLPPGLGRIQDRHPTILLAILSAGNEKVLDVLKTVPATHLSNLPLPYGTAFQILTAGREDLTCASSEVVSLAQVSTRGVESARDVNAFIEKDFERHVSALSVALSYNNDNAKKLLEVMINHPNYSIANPQIDWARKVALVNWTEIEPVDQLFLLAGVPLRDGNELEPATMASLFLHPSPKIRGYAVGLSLDMIHFLHPGATKVLQQIQNNPEIMSSEQLVLLGQILQDPEKTMKENRNVVQLFITSKPPVEIASTLLLSTEKSNVNSVLDSALTMYLIEAMWKPNISELLVLSEHPNKVTRMYAYQMLFEFEDKEHAILLLKGALEKETIPEYKEQLENLIQSRSDEIN